MNFEDFLSTSSEEEDEETTIPCRVRNRRLRDNGDILDKPDKEFREEFRMTKDCFRQLLKEVGPKYAVTSKTPIPPIIKLATFLRFLGSGSYKKAVGDEHAHTFLLSQKSVSGVIAESLKICEEYLSPKWIEFQMTQEEELETKRKFLQKYGIPGVIGCVGGMHIMITSPDEDLRHLYCNSDESYSINALLICDYDMVIRCVDARHPGGNDNSSVWKLSDIEELLSSRYESGKRNTWLLGDSSYPLMPYLMTPYLDPRQRYEMEYNKKLSRARNIIERCFEDLKNRFRCVSGIGGHYYSSAMTTQIVNACCAIHNVCMYHKSYWEMYEDNNDSEDISDDDLDESPTRAAIEARDALANEILC